MKPLAAIVVCFAILTELSSADAVVSCKSFSIVSKFQDENWSEKIQYSKKNGAWTKLQGYPWPAVYSISPNESWILRTQKNGSGDNIAILYSVGENGRIMEVVDFDSTVWSFIDSFSRLKQKDLYHTGVQSVEWTKDGKVLVLHMKGSSASKSGDGLDETLLYDLATGTFHRKSS